MPVTLQNVLSSLDREEPDYAQAATLGPGAFPHLRGLIQGQDLGLASKATFLAGAIDAAESVQVLEIAARHSDPIVRVAAAASAKHVKHLTASLISTFLADTDPGVRKWGLRTLEVNCPHGVRTHVEKIMTYDPEPSLREQARNLVDRLQ